MSRARRRRRFVKRLLTRNLVRWGNLRRTTPVSAYYGFDRGTPVDRVYIERFIELHADDIHGRVLEVQDRTYTERFGGGRVTDSDILDVRASNPEATVVADLTEPDSVPEERFDCVVMTQTLQYLDDPAVGLRNVRRALVPGGVALITVPTLARIDPDLRRTDFWRLTPRGLEELLRRSGSWAELDVHGYGNVLAGVAFLFGVSAEELRDRELAELDADFPLVACARATKPGPG